MWILSIISVLSLIAIFIVFGRKISWIKNQIKEGNHSGSAPNFFEHQINLVRSEIAQVYTEAADYLKPKSHYLASKIAETMYKVSSLVASESLRLYNFIQGRRVLHNRGTTSLFIRDISLRK